jgi:hypothetical protein
MNKEELQEKIDNQKEVISNIQYRIDDIEEFEEGLVEKFNKARFIISGISQELANLKEVARNHQTFSWDNEYEVYKKAEKQIEATFDDDNISKIFDCLIPIAKALRESKKEQEAFLKEIENTKIN